MVFAHDYSQFARPHGEEKPHNFRNQFRAYLVAGAVLCGVTIVGCTRSPGVAPWLLSMAFVFVGTILSRYYWSIGLLWLLFLSHQTRPLLRTVVAVFLTAIFVGHYTYEALGDSPYHSYLLVNLTSMLMFPVVALCAAVTTVAAPMNPGVPPVNSADPINKSLTD